MATTGLRSRPTTRRTATADSAATSKGNSPFDSPAVSASSTSLSSLSSVGEEPTSGTVNQKSDAGVLLDTYGNEFELPDFTIKQIRDAIPAHCFERSGVRGLGYV